MKLQCDGCGAKDQAMIRVILEAAARQGQLVKRDNDGDVYLPDPPGGEDAYRAPLLCRRCRESLRALLKATGMAADGLLGGLFEAKADQP